MNQDIKKLITHLSEHSPSQTRLTGKDLLEQLWYCYLEEKTVDPHQIRDGFREIDILLPPFRREAQARFLTQFVSNATGISGKRFWMG